MMLMSRMSHNTSFLEKVKSVDYVLVFVVLAKGIISCFAMYSTDGGSFSYYTKSHIIRFSIFFLPFPYTFFC